MELDRFFFEDAVATQSWAISPDGTTRPPGTSRICSPALPGRRISTRRASARAGFESVVEALLDIQGGGDDRSPHFNPEREVALRRHIGDYTLFMLGVFQERVERMASSRYYIDEGKRAYRFVAEHRRAAAVEAWAASLPPPRGPVRGLRRRARLRALRCTSATLGPSVLSALPAMTAPHRALLDAALADPATGSSNLGVLSPDRARRPPAGARPRARRGRAAAPHGPPRARSRRGPAGRASRRYRLSQAGVPVPAPQGRSGPRRRPARRCGRGCRARRQRLARAWIPLE